MDPRQTSSTPSSMSSDRPGLQQRILSAFQNFCIGAVLTGLPIFVYFSLSLEMSHITLAQVGRVKLFISIAIPIICGLLAVLLGRRVTDPISVVFESLNLPF